MRCEDLEPFDGHLVTVRISAPTVGRRGRKTEIVSSTHEGILRVDRLGCSLHDPTSTRMLVCTMNAYVDSVAFAKEAPPMNR